MGNKDHNVRKPREGERDEVPPEDASARDSLAGDAANKIDPDMGTPEAAADPVEPQSHE
ncbi:hypothetical protein J2W14_000587 [Pseudarthrobacter oxydans]|nr:hypothetical protein [Pseudarthrobacter oxydans]